MLGAWQASAALYIPVKARLAQTLLEHAWMQTTTGTAQARPWPWADTSPVARLRAPAQDVDLIVLSGATGRTLAFGPALADGSARPGGDGTSVIVGHRDTHFAFLKSLRVGDVLELQSPDGASERFVVRLIEIVDSRDARLRLDDQDRTLVLVTCYPFEALMSGGPLRYVVTANAM